jgi:hypothetical protein
MSHREVIRIIGTEGEESASGHFDGAPGVIPSVTTKIYSWANRGGSNMNAMFQNDKLVTKAQFGLK